MPLLAAAAAGIAFVVHLGREELVHRETHLFEQIAGIVARRAAFLGGHTEIINGNKHLDIAHELDNGENPERDKDDLAVPSVGKGAAVPLAEQSGMLQQLQLHSHLHPQSQASTTRADRMMGSAICTQQRGILRAGISC